jgi:hypothetical protein
LFHTSGISRTGELPQGKTFRIPSTDYGAFNVKLTVKNRANQTSSVTKSVNIVLNTAIKQAENSNSFRVYPNPVNDKFTVELTGKSDITIYNSTGKLIITKPDAEIKVEIDAQSWQPGVYLVSVRQNNKTGFSKIVKQ